MLNGKRASVTRDTAEECLVWAANLMADRKQEVGEIKTSQTMREMLYRYHAEVGKGKKGARQELAIQKAFMRWFPVLSETQIHEITPAMITAWRNERSKKVKSSTVLREFAYLSAVMTYAQKELFQINSNPFFDAAKPRQGKARRRRITDSEIQGLLLAANYDGQSAPEQSQQWVAWAFLVALETAMRQGEILSMQWQHLNTRHVHLPTTKNGEFRDVPLSTEAKRLFDLLEKGKGPIIPLTHNAFRLSQNRVWTKADAGFTFHDSRHEAISRFVKTRRLPVEMLMKITGHKTASVLINTYYNPTVDELADLLN